MSQRIEKEFLNVEEVAEWLNVTSEWVYDAKAQGKIPFVTLGRQLRFHVPTVRQWLADNTYYPVPAQRQPTEDDDSPVDPFDQDGPAMDASAGMIIATTDTYTLRNDTE